MDNELKSFLSTAQVLHRTLYNEMHAIMSTNQNSPINQLAEVAFVFKKSSELLDDIRKQVTKAEALLETIICKKWVLQAEPTEIATDYIVAQPKLKMQATLPSAKTDDENYTKLLQALEIPEHCWPLIRLHWPAMCDHLTELAEVGKPFPNGLDPRKISPQYSLRFYQRKEIIANDHVTDECPF